MSVGFEFRKDGKVAVLNFGKMVKCQFGFRYDRKVSVLNLGMTEKCQS